MISKKSFSLFFILIFLFSSFSFTRTSYNCHDVVNALIKKINDVQRLKYDLKIVERTKGVYNHFSSSVKLNRIPRKLYLYTSGIEVLWVEGANKGNALVKPNSFPFFNLNLDPNGSLMRDGQHHTINEMGFDYFGSIVEHIAKSHALDFDRVFKLEGEETINNRSCYKVIINAEDFKFTNYTVQKNENLISIARKLFVSEYMILEHNLEKTDDYTDVKAGQVIQVPTAYARHVVVYVDKQYFLPISVKINDDKGLYEQYDYFFLQVNPRFEDAEFTREYKSYGF